jgi:hypothetical protein
MEIVLKERREQAALTIVRRFREYIKRKREAEAGLDMDLINDMVSQLKRQMLIKLTFTISSDSVQVKVRLMCARLYIEGDKSSGTDSGSQCEETL